MIIRAEAKKPQYLITACVMILLVFGLAMLSSASSNLGESKFGDTYYYLKHQALYGGLIGLIGFYLMSKIPYKKYLNLSLPLLIISIVLLVLIFTPWGVSAKGATRWLSLFGIPFQPSETLKITYIMYLAAWLAQRSERRKDFWKGFVPFLCVSALVAGLLLAQHSTSIVVILIASGLIVYFVSGAKLRYIFGTVALGLAVLTLVTYVTPYRFERIKNFLNPQDNALAGGYHLSQALIAIGSGSIKGVGYGQSTTKISTLPEPIGDSIFAVIAEETGFIGSMALLAVFGVLIGKIFIVAWKKRDKFGQLMLVGFGSVIAIQTLVNIGAISGILPLTGTPLPFISYGSTALIVFLAMSGLVVNIVKSN